MFKRFMSFGTSLVLVLGIAVTSNAAPISRSDRSVFTYDDYLTGHLSYPAKVQADRFLVQQEKFGKQLAPDATADYGKKGCEAPAEYEVGDTRTFWASQQQTGNQEIDATLAAKSPHGYVWVMTQFYLPIAGTAPEGGFVTQGEAELAAEKWEAIYDTDRKYFGTEPNPKTKASNLAPGLPSDWRDADCDQHISILNFPIDAPGANQSLGYIAGYYSSEHEFPNGEGEHESPFSNETEMFFMNSAFLDVGDDTYAGVLAHEFFHMIQFANDYNEETWVNEGMADIAAVVNGFGDIVQGHIDGYEATPDQHMIDWSSTVDDYGQAFLYFDYFFNHYGEPDDPDTEVNEAYLAMAKLLTKTPDDGLKGITKVLKSRPNSVTSALNKYYRKGNSAKVFRDYLVANYLDMPEAAKGQYGYANRDVMVASAGSESESAADATAFPYGGDFYEFGADQEGDIEPLTAEDPVAVIPANEGQPDPQNGFFAWGGRGDELLTWMERPADLTNATAPALVFKHWFQIEADWDYAYVRVSEDDGNTWTFLNTSECGGQNTDPNGNNRAVLESGGITGDSEGWQDCTLDLTAYAGKNVLVRWEYDTDQAVTEPGYVVDNLSLTDGENTIWAENKFETADEAAPFTFEGSGLVKWRRIKPLANNKPLVQLITVSGDGVRRKVFKRGAFTPGEMLTLNKAATVRGDRTILIITSTTPLATTPFVYSYKLQ